MKTGWKIHPVSNTKRKPKPDYCGFGASPAAGAVVAPAAGAAAAAGAAVEAAGAASVFGASSFLPQAVKTKAAIKVAKTTR